jgi:hypothetical protein
MRDHAQALGEPIIRAGLLAGATSRFVLVPLATRALDQRLVLRPQDIDLGLEFGALGTGWVDVRRAPRLGGRSSLAPEV